MQVNSWDPTETFLATISVPFPAQSTSLVSGRSGGSGGGGGSGAGAAGAGKVRIGFISCFLFRFCLKE